MSIRAKYEDGVFKPLDTVKGATPGTIYMVLSQDELRDLCDWLNTADKSFEFWNNEDDAVYDTL